MSLTEAEARRVRPLMSGVVAMAVAVVVAIGWYYAGRPDESTRPVRIVEWTNWVKAGRADGKLVTFSPAALPSGWRATSATYRSGVDPGWHLGLLTKDGKFVGIEESKDASEDLIQQYVDENATQQADVRVAGIIWQVWTDSGGDYALVRSLPSPDGETERLLVIGSAPDQEVRDFAASLSATAVPSE